MRHRLTLALVVGLTLLAVDPAAAQSYKAEFKNSLVTAANTSWGEAAIKFADLMALEVGAWQKAEARKGLDGSTAAVDQLRREGMDVVVPTAAEIDGFRAKTRAVYDKWAGDIGGELVKSAERIIARTK